MIAPDAMAVVVVTHQSAEHLPGLADVLHDQLREYDELVIVSPWPRARAG